MFDRIARRYDLLNRLLSFGIDQRWRRETVRALELQPGARVLDHATGTADLALRIAGAAPQVEVVGRDPSAEMLALGEKKVAQAGFGSRVHLGVGDAQDLSEFGSSSFDAVTMAFGIRNIEDRPRALSELTRVTKPGGVVAILELSEPRQGLLGPLARFHLRTLVPLLGGALSGSREYIYLQRSVAHFPAPSTFSQMLSEAGLRDVRARQLTFGVCHLFVGKKAR